MQSVSTQAMLFRLRLLALLETVAVGVLISPAEGFPDYRPCNEVLTTQVNQMGSLLLVGQVCTDAVDHHHDQSAIIHIEPVRTADEFVFAVPCRLYPVCCTCRQIPWKMTQLERHLTEHPVVSARSAAEIAHRDRTAWRLELRNVVAKNPFERSHRFPGILHSMLQLREDRCNLILELQTPLLEPCENLVGGRLFPRLDAIDISV